MVLQKLYFPFSERSGVNNHSLAHLKTVGPGPNIRRSKGQHATESMAAASGSPIVHSVIGDRLYITQGVDSFPASDDFHCFKPSEKIEYFPFCDDFGPMNFLCVVHFIEQLEQALDENPKGKVFYMVDDGKRNLANAVFLLGSYMLLSLEMHTDDVVENFSWVNADLVEDFRDATFSAPSFRLAIADCWRGLAKGMQLSWVRRAAPGNAMWGRINIEQYAHYDCPLQGDLHEVVPGLIFAFKGPVDLGALEYLDDARGHRHFSPAFCADMLNDMDVATVVRLNAAEYDGAVFNAHGIRLLDIPFADCTAPPPRVAIAFLSAVDAAEKGGRAVAVHCLAGLGRTGTLIALWLMRSRGFTAREAMGWLRIMRPGSVIGEQQHYLCALGRALAHARARALTSDSATAGADEDEGTRGPAAASAETSQKLAGDVTAGTARRAAARARAAISTGSDI